MFTLHITEQMSIIYNIRRNAKDDKPIFFNRSGIDTSVDDLNLVLSHNLQRQRYIC